MSDSGPHLATDGWSWRAAYDLLGFGVEVASNSTQFGATFDRLMDGFRIREPQSGTATFTAIREDDARWELWLPGREAELCESLVHAACDLEWEVCHAAIMATLAHRRDLLHVHGAALEGPAGSMLIVGPGCVGKTTLALAAALSGLRLLSDDVVFVDIASCRPEAFPRSFRIDPDMLSRLASLGAQFGPLDVIGDYLCSSVFSPWKTTPGRPLRYLVLPRRGVRGTVTLRPVSHAEAAVELLRHSKNLRSFARFGLDVLPSLLQGVDCFVLDGYDDLAASSGLIGRLVGEAAQHTGAGKAASGVA